MDEPNSNQPTLQISDHEDKSELPVTVSPSATHETPAIPPAPPGKRSSKVKIILLLVILILLAAGSYLAYHKHHNSKPASTSNQSKDVSLLRVGSTGSDFGGIYPDMSVNSYSVSTNEQLFEGLVRYEDRTKIVPDLASTWTNPDNDTWIFTIKPGIKFHDGHTLTANDVKYSLDKIITSNSNLAQTFASTISSVEVEESNKVKITTSTPDPSLLNKLTFLYIIDQNLPAGDEPSMAGTGPYVIKHGTKPTSDSVQMVAFDGYHEGRPSVRTLSFATEKTREDLIKKYQAHQYDMIGYVPPDSFQKQLKGSFRFTMTASDVDYIGFNTNMPGPAQNKLVREAVRYAINAKAIGAARGTEITPLSQLIPPSIPGYNPAIKPYKQDISKAKQLLAQAGYPNGVTLHFSNIPDDGSVTPTIASELKQAGITLDIDYHKDFDEFIDYFNSGKAEMFSVDYVSDTLDGLDIYTSTLAPANYTNQQVTDLENQAATTVDPAKRLKLLQEIAVIVDQDIPVVPFSTEDDLWAMNKNYAVTQDLPSGYLPVYMYKVHLQ